MISGDETTLPTLEPVSIPESDNDLVFEDSHGRRDRLFATPEPEGSVTDREEEEVPYTASYDHR